MLFLPSLRETISSAEGKFKNLKYWEIMNQFLPVDDPFGSFDLHSATEQQEGLGFINFSPNIEEIPYLTVENIKNQWKIQRSEFQTSSHSFFSKF